MSELAGWRQFLPQDLKALLSWRPLANHPLRDQPLNEYEIEGENVKVSDILVKCLEAEGIEYIFGVPGEENADFMAEVYGRLTGNPAGCLGTLGPGATNLITGVANSNMDRAPMLVMTSA